MNVYLFRQQYKIKTVKVPFVTSYMSGREEWDTLPEAVSSSEHFITSAACNLLLVTDNHSHVPWGTSTIQPERLNGNQPWEHPG